MGAYRDAFRSSGPHLVPRDHRSHLRLPGRDPKGPVVGEGRQLASGRFRCRHIHRRIQRVSPFVRALHVPVRTLHGAQDPPAVVLGVPGTPSRREGQEIHAVPPHRLPSDRGSGRRRDLRAGSADRSVQHGPGEGRPGAYRRIRRLGAGGCGEIPVFQCGEHHQLQLDIPDPEGGQQACPQIHRCHERCIPHTQGRTLRHTGEETAGHAGEVLRLRHRDEERGAGDLVERGCEPPSGERGLPGADQKRIQGRRREVRRHRGGFHRPQGRRCGVLPGHALHDVRIRLRA